MSPLQGGSKIIGAWLLVAPRQRVVWASSSNPDELRRKLRFGRTRKRNCEDRCSCTVDRAPQGQAALACRKSGNDPEVAAESYQKIERLYL